MGQSRRLFLFYLYPFRIPALNTVSISAANIDMVCLGFKHRHAEWLAQTKPRNPKEHIY